MIPGTQNVAVGGGALASNSRAIANTAIGDAALTANLTGKFNTAVGFNSQIYDQTGKRNTAVGAYALEEQRHRQRQHRRGNRPSVRTRGEPTRRSAGVRSVPGDWLDNIAIGHSAGSGLVTGSNNIFIGSSGADESNTIRIGSQASTPGRSSPAFAA